MSSLAENDYRDSVLDHLFYPRMCKKRKHIVVYKFEKIMPRIDFSDQFRKIIIRQKRIGYTLNVMRQSACLVINFVTLFNCTPVDRASDSMMAPT